MPSHARGLVLAGEASEPCCAVVFDSRGTWCTWEWYSTEITRVDAESVIGDEFFSGGYGWVTNKVAVSF